MHSLSREHKRAEAVHGGDQPVRFRVYTHHHMDAIRPLQGLSDEERFAIRVVSQVLPFRVNDYVIEELIDWSRVPDDPMYQLTFPQRDMLEAEDFAAMASLVRQRASRAEIAVLAARIRATLNPHPAGQSDLNVPIVNGQRVPGLQHKYRETVLYFPARGQVCHAYCTFCFRWAQFVGDKSLKFASSEPGQLVDYLRTHEQVSDVLLTGGDPMVMGSRHLSACLEPLLSLEHIQNIRIGTKSLTFWPYRYTSDQDASDVLRLFERLVKHGKHVAVMAHYNHWRELDSPIAREAIRRIGNTGAVIRSQGPILRHINDDPDVWARLWRTQVGLCIVPYYMFVARDTGAQRYFEVPLARCWEIFQGAIQQVSGLARTVRGPSMSATPGKVEMQGIARVAGQDVFVLRFLQGRNPDWVHRPFFAAYDDNATWLDQLEPAFGQERFFFQGRQ